MAPDAGTVVVCGHSVFSAAAAALLAEVILPADALDAATQLIAGVTHGEADGLLVCRGGAAYLCRQDAAGSLSPEVSVGRHKGG